MRNKILKILWSQWGFYFLNYLTSICLNLVTYSAYSGIQGLNLKGLQIAHTRLLLPQPIHKNFSNKIAKRTEN